MSAVNVKDQVGPMVVRNGLLAMQVCVPSDYIDEQAEEFANDASPTGIRSQWRIAKSDDGVLGYDNERSPCCERAGYVHMVLTC